MLFEEKSKQSKVLPNKSKLDQVLWFIENYLPHKKERRIKKKIVYG